MEYCVRPTCLQSITAVFSLKEWLINKLWELWQQPFQEGALIDKFLRRGKNLLPFVNHETQCHKDEVCIPLKLETNKKYFRI